MRCPYCGHPDSKVIDSRDAEDSIRRRRECLTCASRFTTRERVQAHSFYVLKKDGRREEFDREKLLMGLRIALKKRALPAGTLEKTANEIEAEVQRSGREEVTSRAIGELIMNRLRRLDRVAYIRFASVYREFEDVEDMERELEELRREAASPDPPQQQLRLLPGEEAQARRGRRRRAFNG